MTQLRFRQEKQSNKFRVTKIRHSKHVRLTGERVQGDRRVSQSDKGTVQGNRV